MSIQYRDYTDVFPRVFPVSELPHCVTLHAREYCSRALLDGVGEIRVIRKDSPVPGTLRTLLDDTPPAELRREANGDLTAVVTTPFEGEYSLCLGSVEADGKFVEKTAFSIYALRDDLYRLTPYKGDFHMHSNASDGAHSPEYVAATSRRLGLDFMALTDHRKYAPSLVARDAMASFGCDMLVCPGEEIHLPDNPVHIVNFGGGASINQAAAEHEAEYRAAVAEYQQSVPTGYDPATRFQVGASEWAFDRIRDCGGVAMFCHPYWRPRHHNYVGSDVVELLMEHRRFDVLEVIGGFMPHEIEDNLLAVSRWQESLARGARIPVAGVSDSHDCDTALAGWYYTVTFAGELKFESLAEAIRA
ncbi:MAG: CehA/McbA family metallohydrolase, partial [Lentisphaeria bacterium]|nr:CehA/McbA family metallohydrolase [Lentisphaeria bacterium]